MALPQEVAYKTKYKKPINEKKELDKFQKEVNKYPLNKIISLDETSTSPAMIKEYSRCQLGKRCVYKTDDPGLVPTEQPSMASKMLKFYIS